MPQTLEMASEDRLTMALACSKGYFGSSGKRVNTTTPPLASSSFKVTLGIYVNELH